MISSFHAKELLLNNTQSKSVVLLGDMHGERAIVSVEKSIFPPDFSVAALGSVQELNRNDVYTWNTAQLTSAVKVNVICPATDTHVKKYRVQKYHMVRETPQVYAAVVKPYIDTQKGSRIQWVHNILHHGKEKESFVHHKEGDDGYVLLPDMKWDGKSVENLYLVAIVKRDIASVRDLAGHHLGYLEALNAELKEKTTAAYGILADSLRVFVHYQPSYYHFHIHIVNIGHPGLGDGIVVGKAILLDDIIENIRMDAGYYQKRTMFYQLGENHDLWLKLQATTP